MRVKKDEAPALPVTAIVDPTQRAKIEDSDQAVSVGQWYWIAEEKKPWFACVTHVGSNYVHMEDARGYHNRIHADEFEGTAKYEPEPDRVIAERVAACKASVVALMGEIKAVTASLAIAPSLALGGGVAAMETQALALRNQGEQDMKSYGSALEKAKAETLPALFEKVRKKNEEMATWMSAQILPMKAQAEGLTGIIDKIKDRIFSVSLYAGLSEDVEQIQDGDPASLTTKIHLFQRRLYMDEECLAHYEAGGMEFKDLKKFEAWLLRPDNLARTLPFPRCVVAFRVRHFDKRREIVNPIDMFSIVGKIQADQLTFLYIRNGQQVFRMATKIEFGSNLFPDLERSGLTGKLWGTPRESPDIVTDAQRKGALEEYNRDLKKYQVQKAAYEAALKTPEALAKAKQRGLKKPDGGCVNVPWPYAPRAPVDLVPFDRDTVYFDDMKEKIEGSMKEHNRIALVLQGLLDRSPVFHPHPPWQIWTQAGFESAFELIHDDTRGLTPGEKPDFEAYRQRLNKTLKAGSITVGQQTVWMKAEADKEAERRRRDHRHHGEHFTREYYQPYGNPGPGTLARIETLTRTGRCTWSWLRERTKEKARTNFSCGSKHILNVDAYKPGDFKQFFADPRTRAEYLKWAPMLIAAEDYHAGKGKPVHEPVAPAQKKPSSWEGQVKYHRMKTTKAWVGKAIRLRREVETSSGLKYPVGSLWRVTRGSSLQFAIKAIEADGVTPILREGGNHINVTQMTHDYFEEDPTIPENPDYVIEKKSKPKPSTKVAPLPEPDEDDSEEDEDPGFSDDDVESDESDDDDE